MGDRDPGGAGLADGAAVQVGDLVGADDPRLGKLAGAGLGLEAREPDRGLARRLGAVGSLIDFGLPRLERQAEALQQFPAVAGARGQD